MEVDDDFALAMQLQSQFDDEIPSGAEGLGPGLSGKQTSDCQIVEDETSQMSLVDPRWEMIDPIPDIRALFLEFNDKYFWGRLAGIEVRWSPRMTLCAGLCVYEGRGGMCSVRLSEPLLKLRPRKDLIETLLHEMIHAYLFVTDNNKDHDGHGPEFCKHMHRLNKKCGTGISIYHNFHDEVDHHRQHWWRCNGPCQSRKPYFGYVKRAMNRAPSARDPWWPQHQASCGGTYTKIKEPEGYGKKKEKKKEENVKAPPKDTTDIRSLFKKKEDGATSKTSTVTTSSSSSSSGQSFPGSGITIGGSGTSVQGPIVRKLPGIGTVTTERNNNITSNSKSGSNANEVSYTTPNPSIKRTLSISDSEVSAKKPKINRELKRNKSLSDFLKDKPETPPGTAEKVPGFRSTANRKNWNDKIKKNTTPIISDDVYIPLGKNTSRPNVTPNSVLSKEDRAKLRQLVNEARSPVASSSTGTGIWANEIGASNGSNRGESVSEWDTSRPVYSIPSSASTSARDDSFTWTGASGRAIGATGAPSTMTGASGSAIAGVSGAQSTVTGANSVVSGAKEVACPVCTLLMPENQINAHLDSCLL